MLYLVPTPIGNLEDITLRALRVLREVDLIACEDTRISARLLQHYGITTPTTSYHAHNEARKATELIGRLKMGARIALITDAGMPGISDPGFFLVRACIQQGLPVVALPGPNAFVPALVASGLPTDRFVFEGFLPTKKGRQKRLMALAGEPRTLVFYEAPHRLIKTLDELAQVLGDDRAAVVVRELTKTFEELARGTLRTLHTYYAAQNRIRGEVVLIVAGSDYRPDPYWPRDQAQITPSFAQSPMP